MTKEYHEIDDIIVIHYKYSFGGQSRFFIELKNNKQIMGTKCPKCKTVYCPPRIACAKCYETTEWIPLKDTGEIKVSTLVWYSTSAFIQNIPYAVGYIQLDGASTAINQGIFSDNLVPSKVKPGKRVRAVFKKEREGKITDFFFVPIDEYDDWIQKPEFEGGKNG
ncbi:MAG: Zn-ribbon domain-containing OB-fold protein [Candidatus Helarchaeota archaeon]